MKTIEELLDEVESRKSKPYANIDVPALWGKCEELADYHIGYDNFNMAEALASHSRLLRIVVCITEKAIDGWIDGLQELYEEYS